MRTGVTDRQRSTGELFGLIRQADVVFADVLRNVTPEHQNTDLAPDLCEAPCPSRVNGWAAGTAP
jgi:hypothetical protein